MKRYLIVLMLGIAFAMLFSQDVTNSSDTNDESGINIGIPTSFNKIFFGVTNSFQSVEKIGDAKLYPVNGFHIGVSNTDYFLKINGKTILEQEVGFKYNQRNYKLNSELVNRDYLDMLYNIRYDFLSFGEVYPFIGFDTSWQLTGPKQNKTWVNDMLLNVGLEAFGFRYEYSHGTFGSDILSGTKTNTHSFSFGIKF